MTGVATTRNIPTDSNSRPPTAGHPGYSKRYGGGGGGGGNGGGGGERFVIFLAAGILDAPFFALPAGAFPLLLPRADDEGGGGVAGGLDDGPAMKKPGAFLVVQNEKSIHCGKVVVGAIAK